LGFHKFKEVILLTITYELGDSLYINITNRCKNRCDFCVRQNPDWIKDNLWLEREPTAEEIIEDLKKRDLGKYKEIVYCGYGEPTEKIDELIESAKFIKSQGDYKIRINTNGLGNLIHKRDITPLFRGLIDVVSISLNAKNAKEYDVICHSVYGEEAFYALIEFAKLCKDKVGEVVFTVVDILPKEDIEECKKIAEEAGARLRVREMIN